MSRHGSRTLIRNLIAACCLAGAAGPASAGDWPRFLGPEGNGFSAETGLASSWPNSGPPRLWAHKIGTGYSGPAVVGERVVVFHRQGDEDVVECLDASTGQVKWRFAYATSYSDRFGKGDGPRTTPLISGGRVYTLGAAGNLHCLELDTGKKVWSRALADDYPAKPSFFGIGAAPLVDGTRLLLNVGGRGAGIVGFDAATGKELWKATNHEASYAAPIAATIDGVRHAFFFTREGIVSVDPASGAVRFQKHWRSRNDASVNAATPVVLDGHVFVSASYDTGAVLLKVGTQSGTEVWKSDEVLSCHYSSCVPQGEYLFGFDGRQEQGARLRCIQWKTGKVQWTKEGFGCGSIVRADGRLIALTERGEFVLLEATARKYSELARVAILKSTRAPFALSNGRLFARDNEQVICLDVKKK